MGAQAQIPHPTPVAGVNPPGRRTGRSGARTDGPTRDPRRRRRDLPEPAGLRSGLDGRGGRELYWERTSSPPRGRSRCWNTFFLPAERGDVHSFCPIRTPSSSSTNSGRAQKATPVVRKVHLD